MMDEAKLEISMACPTALALHWLPFIKDTLLSYDITSRERASAFLAQVGHESAGLRYKAEIASGEAYEGRLDLGNRYPGDGKKFKGHGLIQLTGRDAHEAYAVYKKTTIDEILVYIQTDEGAADSAGWFWRGMPLPNGTKKKPWDLNVFADLATWWSFYELSIRINGKSARVGMVEGLHVNLPNGWEDRCARYSRTWDILT